MMRGMDWHKKKSEKCLCLKVSQLEPLSGIPLKISILFDLQAYVN